MSSPFEAAGFTTYRLPQSVQDARTTMVTTPQVPQQPAVQTPSAATVPVNTPSGDVYTPAPAINRDDLKEEIRKEIIEEMRTQQELENKEKAAKEKKKNKLGPIKRLKRFIGNVKKGVVTAGEYSKGFFKGTVKGSMAGGILGGGIYALGKSTLLNNPQELVNTPIIGKAFRNLKIVSNPEILDKSIVAKLLKNKTTAIVVAGVAFAAAMIGALWNASISANEKRALIEHKYESTPVTRK